jgi:glycine cleavage system aminomethyltransferase T
MCKHAVMCNDNGLISAHGVLQRLADDDFRLFVSGPWPRYLHSKTTKDIRLDVENNYLFQIAGPTSLETLEAATGESLRDIAFLRFRNSTIAGKTVQVLRVGMSGTLAYELHGPIEDGPEVYQAVLAAGRSFGIERLGWQTYPVNHIEAGFPQQNWTFTSGAYDDAGFLEYTARVKPIRFGAPEFSGSVDPADIRSRQRTVTEVGWQRSVKLDHDFIGRRAVEQVIADQKRTIVTLEWNSDDVVDVYASMFRNGEEYKYLEMPSAPNYRKVLAHADHVLIDGKRVGVSAGIAYSYYYRKVISHGVIDIAASALGTNVTIEWGDYAGKIKNVRASVARYPYLKETRNQESIV